MGWAKGLRTGLSDDTLSLPDRRRGGYAVTAQQSYTTYPDNLPVPEDDGAADHLVGLILASVPLPSTGGGLVDLAKLKGQTVLYCYPKTGVPGQALPQGWDDIPGARGCTPEACAFRDHFAELKAAGADHVFGLSTQDTAYQKELHDRLHLPFPILSDAKLDFAGSLGLPTFEAWGDTLIKRITLIIRDAAIEHVFYPIFPPDGHAAEVLAWLKAHPK
jgi:peroxiredoxin